LPIRVLDQHGSGKIANVASAIYWATKMGAKVINLSLGSESPSTTVSIAINYAHLQGVMVVASTGNTGDTQVTYPASWANNDVTGTLRLSVTSIDSHDVKSDFATYGYAVELAAPGESIFGPAPDEMVAAWTGTSMAAPMVSGALALAFADPLKVPASELAAALKHSTDDVYQLAGNAPYQASLGTGRLNVAAFLAKVNSH
jgi:subtilisin family serine protease